MNERVVTRVIPSPVGELLAGVVEHTPQTGGPALCLLEFCRRPRLAQEKRDIERLLSSRLESEGEFETATPVSELLDQTQQQLSEYFAGERTLFDLPLCLPGTEHHQRVWNELCTIPFGTTISYDELARRVESVPRAVGQANGANRVPIVVPCHRVIAKDGTLHGFGGGIETKRKLLEHEQALQPELFA